MKRIILTILSLTTAALLHGQERFSFIFLPDLHLQETEESRAAFEKLAQKVNAVAPDFILTGGDMVYTAKNATIEQAETLFALWEDSRNLFNAPVREIAGNHEICAVSPESGVDPSHPLWGNGMYEVRIGPRYYAFEHGGWKFIVLDRFRVDSARRKYTTRFDSEQWSWLEREISSTPKQIPLVVALHVPLLNPKAMFMPTEQALDEEAARVLELLKNHNLKLILQGHNHVYMDLLSRGVRFISGGTPMPLPRLNPRDHGIVQVRVEGERYEVFFLPENEN